MNWRVFKKKIISEIVTSASWNQVKIHTSIDFNHISNRGIQVYGWMDNFNVGIIETDEIQG